MLKKELLYSEVSLLVTLKIDDLPSIHVACNYQSWHLTAADHCINSPVLLPGRANVA